MSLTQAEERRIVKHLANVTAELTVLSKLLDTDDKGDFTDLKVFVAKSRKAFKSLVKEGSGELPVENV
jgi:hypothetical protein